MTAVDGVIARIIYLTSLAYSTSNDIALELSTPRFVAPDGVALCAVRPTYGFPLDPSTTSVVSLVEGGSQFDVQLDIQHLAEGEDIQSSSFFATANKWSLSPVEFGTVWDLLGSDQYYATSYHGRRYEDLFQDAGGHSLDGLVQDPIGSVSAGTSSPAFPDAADDNTDDAVQAQIDALLATQRDLNRPHGNCVLLTGSFRQNTRYEVLLRTANPAGPPAPINGTVPNTAAPRIWVAPLTYYSTEDEGLRFEVRGSKRGTLALPRASAGGRLDTLFDACVAADGQGLIAFNATTTTVAECVTAMQGAVASGSEVAADFPFTAPPAVDGTTQWGAVTDPASCPPTAAHSTRHGGECVSCGLGTPAAAPAAGCVCPLGVLDQLVGLTTCSARLSHTGATDASGVRTQVCAEATSALDAMYESELGDPALAATLPRAYLSRAAAFLDTAEFLRMNATFYATFTYDERWADQPTRRTGLGDACNKCEPGGVFTDPATGVTGGMYDVRWEAVNAARLLGYMLSQAGTSCTTLFDADSPFSAGAEYLPIPPDGHPIPCGAIKPP